MKGRESVELDTNVDQRVTDGFGDEWSRFDQKDLSDEERREIFEDYFRIFPFDQLPANAVGMDVGCGSGRWALLVAPRVHRLLCIDASSGALAVARRNCEGLHNADFALASVDALPVSDSSQDFAYSLGVLHHVPDTQAAINSIARKLKPGAPLLLYLYYALETRPRWYRMLWRLSELGRLAISKAPHPFRYAASQILAGIVYWPLARIAKLAGSVGFNPDGIPLAYYRDKSFYVMRTDALDRFGTSLEKRFTREQISEMIVRSGCQPPLFSEKPPYWVAVTHRNVPGR